MSEQLFTPENLVIDNPSKRGNPLTYTVVEHNRFLLDCLSPETAYCQQNYPYGGRGERCIMRHWAEQAEKGAKKGQWRVVTQTTVPAWNERYTEHMAHIAGLPHGEQRAAAMSVMASWLSTQWETLRVTPGKPYWNNAKDGVYHYFATWELMDCWRPENRHDGQTVDKDRPPTTALKCFALHYNSTLAEFQDLCHAPISVTKGQLFGIRTAAQLSKIPLESFFDNITILD